MRIWQLLFALGLTTTLVAQTPPPAKWNIADPVGPTVNVTFDTSEGTWMNVDVSPDGLTIVFDLLGDIYTMPIAGGTATRVLGGPAFEMQPRFSPDGARLAFTSDRDGLWNIWTTKIDGSDPRQISRESRWFVNSPTWAPDGQAIYARKHFVTTRSLGAGEVWMFHAAGSDGLMVTQRENAQKDAGEPAISPDNRYLYYSKDVTPGSTFEYNKDPNGVIFAVMRRDLQTGRERQFVNRAGGSITPRPSPDGRFLAFIRRIRTKSHLFIKDLITGVETAVFDGLDKDLQEAWTVHGVYPQYAWLPNSRNIVVWGQGKLWNVDVGAKKNSQIPFTAKVDLTVTTAHRAPMPVYQDRFAVKMLRDVTVSPDGTQVVFSALGRLYTRALSGGDPQPITRDGDDPWTMPIELDPAWSRDGRKIVYTTWSDTRRGRVVVYDVASKTSRDVVVRPGHYIEASFSPDGTSIVYREAAPDGFRTDAGIAEPGLYLVPAAGNAEPRLVREGGVEPQFDATGQRLFFREQRAQFVLASVKADGSDERVHVQSPNATDIVPSPDGRWVVFSERWHLHVTPLVQTGRPVDIGPAARSIPSAQISRDAGFFIHWSADSKKIHWSLGPEFFTRDMTKTFTFLAGADPKVADPEASGVNIGFTAASDKPSGAIALVGARVLTMAPGAAPIDNGVVVIEGNRITAVGPAARVTIPANARRIDVKGKTIMPGIIDAHAHVGSEIDGIPTREEWRLMANLAFGVTTMHDPSNDLEEIFANAELQKAGLKTSPRLFSTGRILYGAETNFKTQIDNLEDARSHLRRLKAVGALSAKSYNQQRRDARQMILKAARELGVNVVPEGGSLYYMNASHIIDGHTTVEHNLPPPVLYNDIVTVFAKSGVAYTPTLIVSYGALSGEFYWYDRTNVWENARLLQFVPRDVIDPRSRRRIHAEDGDYGHVLVSQGAKKLADAGVVVNIGAHGQLAGLGAHWEMWMLAQGGMANMDVLRAATINPAKTLGFEKELGSLEAGKLADLIVLDGNPLADIRQTESISMVMLNGRLLDKDLNDTASPAKRKPLWFVGR